MQGAHAALRILDICAWCDLTLAGLSHCHIICGGAIDPGQRDPLGLEESDRSVSGRADVALTPTCLASQGHVGGRSRYGTLTTSATLSWTKEVRA